MTNHPTDYKCWDCVSKRDFNRFWSLYLFIHDLSGEHVDRVTEKSHGYNDEKSFQHNFIAVVKIVENREKNGKN